MTDEGMTESAQPKLRLIRGGRDGLALGPLRLTVAPADAPPFEVAATVREEDTWLVLSADPTVTPPTDSVMQIMTELLKAEPLALGSVAVGRGTPLPLLAVVYDLGEEPLCRPEWIESALRETFALVEQRQFATLAMPLLGVRHGRIPMERFAALLAQVIRETSFAHLRRIWLVTPETQVGQIRRLLAGMNGEPQATSE